MNYSGVSVVLPILNEERYLKHAIEAILAQEYPGKFEVILALGPSKDRTNEVARELADKDSRVILVDSPTGRTAAGLNLAIKAAHFEIICRIDGHAEISSTYIRDAVAIMEETGAVNVGGIMAAQGKTAFEKAVATAMRSPLGVGGFAAMRALSTRNDDPATASRPWDKDRDGFVLGEGAGAVVLEEYEYAKARGARIYAEFAGFGRHGRDAIGFFHAPTADVAQGGGTVGVQTHNGQRHGRVGYLVAVQVDGTQRPLTAPCQHPVGAAFDVCTHGTRCIDEANVALDGIGAHTLDAQALGGSDRPQRDEIAGRGGIGFDRQHTG